MCYSITFSKTLLDERNYCPVLRLLLCKVTLLFSIDTYLELAVELAGSILQLFSILVLRYLPISYCLDGRRDGNGPGSILARVLLKT
jgi:hypothetical protein